MKAVMPSVPPEILEWRKRTGAERWDEMWEGVLHMVPMPNREHQDLEGAMEAYLRLRWIPKHKGKVYHNINLAPPGGWPNNYRIPDLVILTPDRFGIDHNEYFEGAPTVVVEIRSPEDETDEKFGFYAQLGVPEVWVIDRDTKEPEIHVLRKSHYEKKPADPHGWITSDSTGLEVKAEKSGKLTIRLANDESTREDLPAD